MELKLQIIMLETDSQKKHVSKKSIAYTMESLFDFNDFH